MVISIMGILVLKTTSLFLRLYTFASRSFIWSDYGCVMRPTSINCLKIVQGASFVCKGEIKGGNFELANTNWISMLVWISVWNIQSHFPSQNRQAVGGNTGDMDLLVCPCRRYKHWYTSKIIAMLPKTWIISQKNIFRKSIRKLFVISYWRNALKTYNSQKSS